MCKRRTFILSLVLILMPSFSWAWSGRVIGIADGDTITVLRDKEQVRIRLFGIDCPERGQAFSKKARQFTAKLVHGKVVEVEHVDVDRYGRTVAMIYAELDACPLTGVSIKTLLNKELVKAGLAWVYTRYCDKPICQKWKRLEFEAREAKMGIWADPHAIPPWEYRRQDRKPGAS